MSSGYLPALSFKSPEISDPMEQYGKVLQMRNMMQQNQAGALDIQQKKRDIQDQQATTAAMKEALQAWDGKDHNDIYKAMPSLIAKNGGSANAVMAMQQKALASKDTSSQIALRDAETGDKKSATIIKNGDIVSGALTPLIAMPDRDFAANLPNALQSLTQNGALDPQHAQSLGALVQGVQAGQVDVPTAKQNLDLYRKSMLAASQQQKEAMDQADLAVKKAQLPGQQAEAQQKVRSNLATQLAGAGSQEAYEQALNDKVKSGEMTVSQARQFPQAYDKDAILSTGMTPHEQASVPVEKIEMKDWLAKNPGKSPADFMKYQKTMVPAYNFNLQSSAGNGNVPLNKSQQATAQAILDGRMTPPSSFALKTPYWQNVMGGVFQQDPDFSEQRAQLRKAYTTGAQSKEINAINTAMGHVGVLGQAIDALNNGNYKVLNQIGNSLGVQVGKDPVTTFNTIVHRVGPELSKAYIGAGGSAGERGADEKDFDPNLGPKQLTTNVAMTARLLRSKIASLENQWDQNKGVNMPSFQDRFIMPEAQTQLNRWAPSQNGGAAAASAGAPQGRGAAQGTAKFTVTDPNGKVHPFGSQSEADRFKKLAGIQ